MAKRIRLSTTTRPLATWIARTHPLPSRFYAPGHIDRPDDKWSTWIDLQDVHPLYKADRLAWLGLQDSRKRTESYLKEAGGIIRGLEGGWLDREEREWILGDLGEPPEPCLPIYIITTGKGPAEKVVYIGKTETNSRFTGGHSAALKLHAPKYQKLRKQIYRCGVWFHDNVDYLALEWLQPESLALELLDSIESQLIYYFKPVFNTQKKYSYRAKRPVWFGIENHTFSDFLHGTVISPE